METDAWPHHALACHYFLCPTQIHSSHSDKNTAPLFRCDVWKMSGRNGQKIDGRQKTAMDDNTLRSSPKTRMNCAEWTAAGPNIGGPDSDVKTVCSQWCSKLILMRGCKRALIFKVIKFGLHVKRKNMPPSLCINRFISF